MGTSKIWWGSIVAVAGVVGVGAVWSAPAAAEIGAGTTFCLPITSTLDSGGLAIVNLTPVLPTAPGDGVLISSDVGSPPEASNVNFRPDVIDPNVAFAPVGSDGFACFHNSVHADVELVADRLALLAAGSFASNPGDGAPDRVADTREGVGGDRLMPSERRCVEVPGEPGDVAVVNLTPVLASAPGDGVLTSSDVLEAPDASNVNFAPGTADPNVALAEVGADGAVCFHNSEHAEVDLVADVLVTIRGDAMTPNPGDGTAIRVIDTREGVGGDRLAPSERRCVAAPGDPGDVTVVNLTPVLASGRGHGVLTSSDVLEAPEASNVNFAPGTADPNVALAEVGADGAVCFHNSEHAEVDLVADVLVTIRADAFTSSPYLYRLVDTRDARRDVVECVTATRCYGAGDQFYLSDDGGVSWRLSESAVSIDKFDDDAIECITADVCSYHGFWWYGLQSAPGAYVTMDGGLNWRVPAAINSLSDLDCPADGTCLAVGATFNYFSLYVSYRRAVLSNDGGRTWRNIELPPVSNYSRLTAITCSSATACEAVSIVGTLGQEVATTITFESNDGWDTVTVTET